MKRVLSITCVVLVGVCTSLVSVQLARKGVRLGVDPADALCIVELAPGQAIQSAEFTTTVPLETFHVMVALRAQNEKLRMTARSGDRIIFKATVGSTAFGGGRDIPPGTYQLAVEQEPDGKGGTVYISERPLGVTGWQVFSRGLVAMVGLSGVWSLLGRRSRNPRHRLASRVTFQYLLLAFLLMFFYLLLHEGGHAFFAAVFGKFSWAGSDFWGLGGEPHSGLKAWAEVQPWQRAAVSFAGPAVPTLAGWALFALWVSARGRRWREALPLINLYYTALILMCTFPAALVLPIQLLGMAADGDWSGFIGNVPGPMWAVKTVLWTGSLFNVAVVLRVLMELRRVWRAHTLSLAKSVGVKDASA